MTRHLIWIILGIGLLAGCAKEPPPRSTNEFFENPILLEAAMVRCSQDRDRTRYDAECINAREAVKRIAVKEDSARKAELEARSESMRRARRRAQEASAEARRRAQEAQQRRQEAEYLAQFGVPLPSQGNANGLTELSNSPSVAQEVNDSEADATPMHGDTVPASDGGNAPSSAPDPQPEGSDLNAIREELRQRNEDNED